MSSGIELAYSLASKTLVKGHLNRVVVLSDGDANIGNTGHDDILRTIAQYKDKGVTLSTVGFGSGNYKDTTMEQLADKGDGNYTYIDGEDEARKVFSEQVDGLLQVVARDVKIQVDLDPSIVARYRLVGYENRDIADKDFRNDKVDAGEVGAGHSVTALYDVELAPGAKPGQSPLVVRMRYKPAKNALHGGSDEASETSFPMPAAAIASSFDQAPENFRFAVAVGAFAEILRKSPHAAEWKLEDVERIAASASAGRKERIELVNLVQTAEKLSGTGVALAQDGRSR
jgi:Ca-activated chloride channel family protein